MGSQSYNRSLISFWKFSVAYFLKFCLNWEDQTARHTWKFITSSIVAKGYLSEIPQFSASPEVKKKGLLVEHSQVSASPAVISKNLVSIKTYYPNNMLLW